MRIKQDPSQAGYHQKNRQGMLPQQLQHATGQLSLRFLALTRSSLIQMFGGQDHDNNPGPIGNGIPKKRADVPLLVADAVQHDPEHENASGDNRKTMPLKERLVL